MPAPRALPPHPALRGVVLGYFAIEPGLGPQTRRIVPDGCVDIVFNLADARGARTGFVEPAAGVVGVLTRPAVVERPANAPLIGVTLAPMAARMLLRAPADALKDRMLDLSDVWGPGAREVLEQLREHAGTADRTKHLDAIFLRGLANVRQPDPVVVSALRLIRTCRGRLPVQALRDELGVTERKLERLFREWTGLTPKGLSRIARVQALLGKLAMAGAPRGAQSWAGIAVDFGFADQAHMIREFRALTGLTPTAYLREPALSGSFNTTLAE